MTPEQLQEVANLRSLNLSPKQIARKLGLRPAEVTAAIRNQAEGTIQGGGRKELPPIEECLVNENAAKHLLERPQRKSLSGNKNTEVENDGSGLAQVIVTRLERGQYLVSSYLVDYWCLGVKNTFGPRKMNRIKYLQLLDEVRQRFQQDMSEITLQQAQSIIFGAVDYAAKCGLEPHRDFERSKPQLGDRYETLIDIEFGRDGKPFYISGPYDNPHKILETLREHVGVNNFHYISHL
jgi:hypothetical protein